MSAELQSELLRFIASIPPTENPYRALDGYVQTQFLPAPSRATRDQLYFLAALLGATLVLVLVSIGFRIQKRIFWLYSVSHSPAGVLIVPHFSLSWSCVAAVMLILFEFLIAYCVKLFRGDVSEHLGYWIFLVWASAWCGGALAAHALGTGFLLQFMPTLTSSRLRFWTIVSNVTGVVALPIYLAILLPLGIIGGQRFAKLISIYHQFNRFIGNLSNEWVEGTPIDIVKLAPALPLLNQVVAQRELYFTSWKQVFWFYAASALLLGAVLVAIAMFHLSSLRKAIKGSQGVLSTDKVGTSARKQVARTWQTLMMTVIAFVLLAAIFVGISVFAALNPAALEHSPEANIVVLVPLYAFALLGFPTSALLVWRAVEAVPKEGGSSHTKRSTCSKSGSRDLDALPGANKYSIELAGRKMQSPKPARSSRDFDVRFDGGAVSVNVEIEVKEEQGEFDDDEKSVPFFSNTVYR